MSAADVWLVVGLGNPGPKYAGHRHNVGYLVAEELAERLGSPFKAHKSGRADVVEGRLGAPGTPGPRVVLARPRSYMNETGGPVKALATFYKVPPERIVAVHDELDIPFGTMRVKLGGGDNGHNGLGRCAPRSAPATSTGCASASAGRPAGRRSPTSCCPTTPPPSARSSRSRWSAPRTPSRRCSPRASSGPSRSSTPDPWLGLTR